MSVSARAMTLIIPEGDDEARQAKREKRTEKLLLARIAELEADQEKDRVRQKSREEKARKDKRPVNVLRKRIEELEAEAELAARALKQAVGKSEDNRAAALMVCIHEEPDTLTARLVQVQPTQPRSAQLHSIQSSPCHPMQVTKELVSLRQSCEKSESALAAASATEQQHRQLEETLRSHISDLEAQVSSANPI